MNSEQVITGFLKGSFSEDHPGQNTFSEIFWVRQPERKKRDCRTLRGAIHVVKLPPENEDLC